MITEIQGPSQDTMDMVLDCLGCDSDIQDDCIAKECVGYSRLDA